MNFATINTIDGSNVTRGLRTNESLKVVLDADQDEVKSDAHQGVDWN